MNLKHDDTDRIFSLCKQVVVGCIDLIKQSPKTNNDAEEILRESKHFVSNQFNQCDTRYKRKKEKMKDAAYVDPREMGIGLKWQTKITPERELPYHYLDQSTFQYVSIVKTIETLFSNEHFYKMYFDFNDGRTNDPGLYDSYTSGTNFRNCDFFKSQPFALQIQLGFDDCEVVCPLTSKTIIHKLSCIYMQIRNLPNEFLSSNGSTYLVELRNYKNLSQEYTSIQNILDPIIDDLKKLESVGITLQSGLCLNGTLINMAYDNLGGNTIFGLCKSFVANYFCRHCELSRDECHKSISGYIDRLRKIAVMTNI